MSTDFSKRGPGKKSDRRKQLRDELQFLGQMASTETALFHQRAAEYYGFGITDMKTMSVLMQEGPMTAGQLATRLSLTTGAITSLIDRLEVHGAVERVKDPDDRRKVIVRACANPLGHTTNIFESVGEAFDKLLENYSAEELEFIVDFYKRSIELTKQEIAKLANKKRP